MREFLTVKILVTKMNEYNCEYFKCRIISNKVELSLTVMNNKKLKIQLNILKQSITSWLDYYMYD